MKIVGKYFLTAIVLFLLVEYTFPVKYLAPVCYRIDLSMAVVLMMAWYWGYPDKRIWIVFATKVMVSLFFGNPGIAFGFYLLITLSDVILDYVMLTWFAYVSRYQGRQLILGGASAAAIYVVCAVFMNAVYLDRLYAAAYHANIHQLVTFAAGYNRKVKGFWSFFSWSVAPFYSVKLALNIGLAVLLKRIMWRNPESVAVRGLGGNHAVERS